MGGRADSCRGAATGAACVGISMPFLGIGPDREIRADRPSGRFENPTICGRRLTGYIAHPPTRSSLRRLRQPAAIIVGVGISLGATPMTEARGSLGPIGRKERGVLEFTCRTIPSIDRRAYRETNVERSTTMKRCILGVFCVAVENIPERTKERGALMDSNERSAGPSQSCNPIHHHERNSSPVSHVCRPP